MKIILCCVAGLSTTMMMDSMKDVLKKSKVLNEKEYSLEAIPVEQLPNEIEGTDVVLLGPQISYKKDYVEKITNPLNIPYVVIDQQTYGSMDGVTVLKEAFIAKRKAELNQKEGA